MEVVNPIRFEAGIDWCSGSIRKEAEDSTQTYTNWLQVLEYQTDLGNELKVWSLNGYKGHWAAGVFVGERDDGYYHQIPSSLSDHTWNTCYSPNTNYSRIDLHLTIQFDSELSQKDLLLYEMAVEHNKELPKQYQRTINYMAGYDNGYTLYIGSPSSDTRVRIYNKAVESKSEHYLNSWRWEYIGRNDYAQWLANRMPFDAGERTEWAANVVANECARRGVTVPYKPSEETRVFPGASIQTTDIGKKLEWLKKQVRPSVHYLIDSGFTIDVLDALGLSGSITKQE